MDLDLKIIMDSQDQLPGIFWYLAGILQSKSSLSLSLTLKFLQKMNLDFNNYKIPISEQFKVFDLLKNTQIAEAKKLVDSLIIEARNSTKFLETEILDLIQQLKSDPLYSEKIELKLEPTSSFICNLCSSSIFSKDLVILEECPHSFHKNCISEVLEKMVGNKDIRIGCPVRNCQVEVNATELSGIIKLESFKYYQDYSFEFMVGSGKLGKIVECSSCKERFSCDSNAIVLCHKCQVSICSKCLKPKDSCSCYAIVMRRQCPKCNLWVEKGEGTLTLCKKCGFNFCFQCLKFKNDCKCRQ